MFIRGRERVAEVWPRFQVPLEGFIVVEHRGMFEARVAANADRVLEVFLELSRRLSPTISVHLEDLRSGRQWGADDILLSGACTAVRRVRAVFAAHGGVECTFFDDADQVTLSPNLEVFVFGATERWYYFLRELGLPRYRSLTTKSWRPEGNEFPAAPAVDPALTELVSLLALEER